MGQVVVDDKGCVETYDRVVFACPATACANIVRPASWLERVLLRGVGYHDELHHASWKDWLESTVHQDVNCLPEQHRDTILKHAAFVCDVDVHGRSGGLGRNIEYTHNLGAFSPSARAAGVEPQDARMFMSQCLHSNRDIDPEQVVSSFSAPFGHPDLSVTNLVITQMLHLIQGRRGAYFCSNWTSPGNGHDLACTSGLCVASAVGAEYPLSCPDARQDHRECRRFMNI